LRFIATLLATTAITLFAKIIIQVNNDFIIFTLALIIKLHKGLILLLLLAKFVALFSSGFSYLIFNLLK
jgi:hypothetical protein